MRSHWTVWNRDLDRKIIFLVDDFEKNRGQTITNDAENVLKFWKQHLGNDYRVVYKDTDEDWWEIREAAGDYAGEWRIVFEHWDGLVWDVLKKEKI